MLGIRGPPLSILSIVSPVLVSALPRHQVCLASPKQLTTALYLQLPIWVWSGLVWSGPGSGHPHKIPRSVAETASSTSVWTSHEPTGFGPRMGPAESALIGCLDVPERRQIPAWPFCFGSAMTGICAVYRTSISLGVNPARTHCAGRKSIGSTLSVKLAQVWKLNLTRAVE